MSYAVGQTVEVCLEFDVPLAQGVCLVVAAFANEYGEVAELTNMPAGVSECFWQEPRQASLKGIAASPGSYELKRLRVEHLSGVTHLEPPGIVFEVKDTPGVVRWHLR
jgi:hypothetical protein